MDDLDGNNQHERPTKKTICIFAPVQRIIPSSLDQAHVCINSKRNETKRITTRTRNWFQFGLAILILFFLLLRLFSPGVCMCVYVWVCECVWSIKAFTSIAPLYRYNLMICKQSYVTFDSTNKGYPLMGLWRSFCSRIKIAWETEKSHPWKEYMLKIEAKSCVFLCLCRYEYVQLKLKKDVRGFRVLFKLVNRMKAKQKKNAKS